MSTKNDHSDNLMSIRLISARNQKKIKQGDAAIFLEISVSSLNRYEKGHRNAPADILARMAKLYDVSLNWLLTGEGNMIYENELSGNITEKKRDQPLQKRRTTRQIPVISFIQAGGFIDTYDPFPPGFAEEYLTFDEPCGPNTFALVVEGESMMPEFPPGMKIIIDPSLQVENGDLVIVKNGDNQVTFKKLSMDGLQVLLVPLNKQFPTRDMTGQDFKIIGVVIGRYESIRWSRRR